MHKYTMLRPSYHTVHKSWWSFCVMPNTHRRLIRSTIWKLTKQTPYRLITPILINIDNFLNNDVIMSSLLKKLSLSIKIHVVKTKKQTQTQSVWPVSKLSTESVGSRREPVANSCTHRRRRRDETR